MTKGQTAKAIEKFNRANPVGTAGFLVKDGRDVMPTTVKPCSPGGNVGAFLSSSGHAVCFFEGVRGYYLIDRFVREAPAPKMIADAVKVGERA